MSRPGGGGSLADRTNGPVTPPATVPSGRELLPEAVDARHCFLLADDGGWRPGLLLEWRQGAAGWQGRVAYATPGTDGAVLHETWFSSARLKRADRDL